MKHINFKSIKMLAAIAVFTLVNFASATASIASSASPLTKALVYLGPGSCEDGCSEASAEMAKLAGLEPVYVTPETIDPRIFEGAAIWIQPGGKASRAAAAMAPELKENIKKFIANGGGYVGFCAGGFIATNIIGSTGNIGLGILPGKSTLLNEPNEAVMLPINWYGKTRSIYWEGGPYFTFGPEDGVEVTGTYSDGTAANVRTMYGKGRVYVTGLHPEAPDFWREFYKLDDVDGVDFDLAREMILWAKKRK